MTPSPINVLLGLIICTPPHLQTNGLHALDFMGRCWRCKNISFLILRIFIAQYIKEGVINNILYGSLDFMASNKDFTFPSLEHVGGVGMTVRAVKTISCPKLQVIDGTLCAANAASLTTFNMPTLTKLSGVRFIRLTRFVDYTFFKSFVEEEQIKKEDWLVTNCGYNPTYEDMQAGRYTQQ